MPNVPQFFPMDQAIIAPPKSEKKQPKERKSRIPPEDKDAPRPSEPYVELIAKVKSVRSFSYVYRNTNMTYSGLSRLKKRLKWF